MAQSGLLLVFHQSGAAGITPAAFGQEGIPDFDLFGIGTAACGETPVEDFIIRAAGEGAGAQFVEVHPEKLAETVVEGAVAGNNPEVITVRKLSFGTAVVVRLITPPPNSPGKLAE